MKPRLGKHLFLGFSIILGFLFIVLFAALYASDAIRNDNACGCVIPIPYMILILSTLGLFVGSVAASTLFAREERSAERLEHGGRVLLNCLPPEERALILLLAEQPRTQATLAKLSGFHKVKVHRLVRQLLAKGLVIKEEGRGKSVALHPALHALLERGK